MWGIWDYKDGVEYDDRPFYSHYNWLFDGASGNTTTYVGLHKSGICIGLAVL